MPTFLRFRRSFWIVVGMAVLIWGSSESIAQSPDEEPPAERDIVQVETPKSRIELVEKFSRVLELKAKIERVDGFDPSVLNITALSAHQIRVQALTPGVTTVVLFDEFGKHYRIEVFVNGDARHLQAYLDQMFPTANVKAIKVKDNVILSGWVTQPEHINAMVDIAEQFYSKVLNQIQVGGVQQILLKVKVMEVQRGKIRRMGVNLAGWSSENFFTSTPGDIVRIGGITNNPASATVAAATLGNPTAILGLANDNVTVNAFLDMLKQENLFQILAEPQIVVMNGHPANLLSGGEFPILVPQSLGTVTIKWKEFGTRLEAAPLILGQGKLRLELMPEVSERDFTNAVQVNGFTVPGLTTRRVQTQVEMKFGQTLMIAGLINNRRTTETHKVPFLGELPWIGAAFRRMRDVDNETELVIMITPELVAPLDSSQIPPGGPGLFTDTPVDREFYIDGMLEVPKYGPECIDCEDDYSGQDSIYLNSPYGEPTPVPAGNLQQTLPQAESPALPGPTLQKGAAPLDENPFTDALDGTNAKRSVPPGNRRPGLVVPAAGNVSPSSGSQVQQAGGLRAPPPSSSTEPTNEKTAAPKKKTFSSFFSRKPARTK
ncbi:MAG: pilus assembly protein N-terminal domain-containing protein [Planctomycetota bacterium]|nr:pilus assembly protein N-terminal domain-containing protein [Planctomycetota bacterium]MDA1214528.1 pilus assembly protein N-terminal domain-containing protein [Planctomycetota bacterium]